MTALPVKRQKLTESVAEELRSLISREQFAPGHRLPPERLLAQQMGVSRSSVRDAVARLEVLGHLDVRQGDGIYVCQPSALHLSLPFQGLLTRLPQSARDLLAFRQLIEPEVAALAAQRADTAQIGALLANLEQQQSAAQRGSKLTDEDSQFHTLVAQMAGNEVVVLVLDTLQQLLHTLRDRVLTGDQPSRTVEQHRAVAQAIADRSPERARQAMARHLDSVTLSALDTLPPDTMLPNPLPPDPLPPDSATPLPS